MTESRLRNLVRAILREEIGRNFHTINTDPISYKDYVGYEVDIIATVDGDYILSILFDGKKMLPTRKYDTKEEAELAARNFVERHRLSNAAN